MYLFLNASFDGNMNVNYFTLTVSEKRMSFRVLRNEDSKFI